MTEEIKTDALDTKTPDNTSEVTAYEQIKEGLEDAIDINTLMDAIADKNRENERLKKALRFYANEENGHKARLVLLGDKNE